LLPSFLYAPCPPPHLHSFPTRRSSDLPQDGADGAQRRNAAGRLILARLQGRDLPRYAKPRRRNPCEKSIPMRARRSPACSRTARSEEHTSELQSLTNLVCRLLLETTTT